MIWFVRQLNTHYFLSELNTTKDLKQNKCDLKTQIKRPVTYILAKNKGFKKVLYKKIFN